MDISINISKSSINTIGQLLTFEGKTNENEILYKKTANAFKRRYGIELENAPIIFVKHNTIWKLSHFTYKSMGRTYESAEYLPIVGCKDKFERLSADIKTEWDA